MPAAATPARLDLHRLDDRAVPSAVTVTTTAKTFEFTAAGTLTAREQVTEDGTTQTNTATTAVTVRGAIAYPTNAGGSSGTVAVQGAGVSGAFGFADDGGTVRSTADLTGTGKGLTPIAGAAGTFAPQALTGTFDVSTFRLTAGWGDSATGPTSGTLTATLAPRTPAPTDLAFGTKTTTTADDGTLGLDFTAVAGGDPVKAESHTAAVAHVTAVWQGDGRTEAVDLDVPVYWNTGTVTARVTGLVRPEWADTLAVRLDAAGELAEADEANNTWTIDLAAEPPAVLPVVPPPAVPPVVPSPPVVVPPPPAVPTGFSVGDNGTVEWRDALGQVIGSAKPFAGFEGPVSVAAADVNGDGVLDAVTAAGAGGAPRVHVLDGKSGDTLASYFAYDRDFRGGVNVAAADVNGDGLADIVTGAGAGGGPLVRVFDGGTTRMTSQFVAYDLDFRGGVSVAAVDLDGDGKAEVVTAPAAGGGPVVKAFAPTTGAELFSAYAADPDSRDGVGLEVAVDPAGGVVLYASAEPDTPARRLHSQLTAGGPLLTDLDGPIGVEVGEMAI